MSTNTGPRKKEPRAINLSSVKLYIFITVGLRVNTLAFEQSCLIWNTAAMSAETFVSFHSLPTEQTRLVKAHSLKQSLHHCV